MLKNQSFIKLFFTLFIIFLLGGCDSDKAEEQTNETVLPNFYSLLGNILEAKGSFEESLDYRKKAIELVGNGKNANPLHNMIFASESLHIGRAENYKGNKQLAKDYILRSINSLSEISEKEDVKFIYLKLLFLINLK